MNSENLRRKAYSIAAMRELARRALPRPVFDFAAGGAEFCHSGKKFSAMTERKPQLLEVLLAQTWHYVQINIVLREDFSIFFKANTF